MSGGTIIERQRFSTDGAIPAQRHAAWQGYGAPKMGSVFAAAPDPGFEARVESVEVGPLRLLFGWYGGQSIVRGPDQLRDEPSDLLVAGLAGTMAFDGPHYRIAPGGIGLLDFAQPFEHHSTAGSLVSILIPRAVAVAAGLDPSALHYRVIAPAQAAMLRAHIAAVEQAIDVVPEPHRGRVADSILNLLSVTLALADDATPPHAVAPATLRLRAEQVIAAGVADDRLDIAFLCRTLGISRSTLFALFQADGGVERRIRRVRLAAARTALATSGTPVGEIASRFGFHDVAHFSRVFRTEFGASPTAYRAAQLPTA